MSNITFYTSVNRRDRFDRLEAAQALAKQEGIGIWSIENYVNEGGMDLRNKTRVKDIILELSELNTKRSFIQMREGTHNVKETPFKWRKIFKN